MTAGLSTSGRGAGRSIAWIALALLVFEFGGGSVVATAGPGDGAPPANETESSAPFTGWLPGATPEEVYAVLVVDAETGAPIAGAKVLHHDEDLSPTLLDSPLRGEATTDARGLAWRDARGNRGEQWTVDAAGYAPGHSYGFFPDEVYALSRGRTVRGRLVDPLGSPLVGTTVGLVLNCPHGPTMRRAVTDANGIFALEHVQLHVYVYGDEQAGGHDYPQFLSFPDARFTDGE